MRVIPDSAIARSLSAQWAMAGITIGVLAADQVTKFLIVAGLIPDEFSFGLFSVSVIRNHGATAGVASGYPVLVTLTVFALTAVAAAIAVRTTSRAAALWLAVTVGGAFGNLSDRIFRSPGLGRGAVVDWIHPTLGGGSFDLADVALLLGVLGAMTTLAAARRDRMGRKREAPAPARSRAVPRPAPQAGAFAAIHRSLSGAGFSRPACFHVNTS